MNNTLKWFWGSKQPDRNNQVLSNNANGFWYGGTYYQNTGWYLTFGVR